MYIYICIYIYTGPCACQASGVVGDLNGQFDDIRNECHCVIRLTKTLCLLADLDGLLYIHLYNDYETKRPK